MGLNDTPSANRVHIGFFGCRNAGKSSLVNAVTGQSLAVVSDVAGTTTDPVYKSMELLPLGPVVIVDTPGIDDAGSLGELRVAKTRQVLSKVDVAVLVVDAMKGMSTADRELVDLFHEKNMYKKILTTGALQNHNVSISGGNDRIRFRMSAGLSSEDGPLLTSKDKYSRKNISAFVSADVNKWFTQEVSLLYTDADGKKPKRSFFGNLDEPS